LIPKKVYRAEYRDMSWDLLSLMIEILNDLVMKKDNPEEKMGNQTNY
jgi:hypothetical protein